MMDTKRLVQQDTYNKDTKLSDVTMNSEIKSAGKNVLFNLNVSAEICFFLPPILRSLDSHIHVLTNLI